MYLLVYITLIKYMFIVAITVIFHNHCLSEQPEIGMQHDTTHDTANTMLPFAAGVAVA